MKREIITNYVPLTGWLAAFSWQATPYGYDPETDPIGYGESRDEAIENCLNQMEPEE